MHWTKIAAPMTVLVLTAACGPTKTAAPVITFSEPAPSVSPAGGPGLKPVWQVPDTVAHLWDKVRDGTSVAGNVVVAMDAKDDHELDFIDGTTGRITGHAATPSDPTDPADPDDDTTPYVSPAADGHGRPLVVLHTGKAEWFPDPWAAKPGQENVYDTAGHHIWGTTGDGVQYAGGYIAEPHIVGHPNADGKNEHRTEIRTPSGRSVAHWPLPSYVDPDDPDFDGNSAQIVGHFQAVRPGLLVATRWNFSLHTDEIVLLDVSRPGKARVSPLRTPFKQSIGAPDDPKPAVAGDHLYVIWDSGDFGKRAQIARYDPPDTRPAWHHAAPAGAGQEPYISAYPGANGGTDAVQITGDSVDTSKSWFLRPDTGAVIGSRAGQAGADELAATSGGRAYVGNYEHTKVVDLRTGAVTQTIDAPLNVTANGTLIYDDGKAITAYRPN